MSQPSFLNTESTEKNLDSFAKIFASTIYNLRTRPLRSNWVRLAALWMVIAAPPIINEVNKALNLYKSTQNYYYLYFGILSILMIGAFIVEYRKIQREKKQPPIPLYQDSPVKGLLSFDFQDSEVFKNLQRQNDINKLRNALLSPNFKIGLLVGDSGSGKTSLLRAGLAPLMKTDSYTCVVATFTNENPIRSIHTALSTQLNLKDLPFPPNCTIKNLLDASRQVIQQNTIILILDQFEQFYTQFPHPETQIYLVEQLKEIKEFTAIRILISLRSDFVDNAIDLMDTIKLNQNYFKLEKFSVPQVTRILEYIANASQAAEFDEVFISNLIKGELADASGKVLPTDIQIIALMLQNRQDRLDFSEQAFRKIGGIDGLLQRYLEEQLETPNVFNRDNNVLYTLLTLIDGSVRAGQLTIEEISHKHPHVNGLDNLKAMLKFLIECRLVREIKDENRPLRFELVHERLIEPIRRVENKTQVGPRKATALLQQRVNEWVSNKRSARYLLTLKEYRQVNKFERLVIWGPQEILKKELLSQSLNRIKLQFYGIGAVICVLLGYWGFTRTTYYQLTNNVPSDIERIIMNKLTGYEVEVAFDSLAVADSDFAMELLKKAYFNGVEINKDLELNLVKHFIKFNQFPNSISIIDIIEDPLTKINALCELSTAEKKANILTYKLHFDSALKIADSIHTSDIYTAYNQIILAKASANIYDYQPLIKKSLDDIRKISNIDGRVSWMNELAKTMIKVNASGYQKVLDEALIQSDSLEDKRYKLDILNTILFSMSHNNKRAPQYILDQALKLARSFHRGVLDEKGHIYVSIEIVRLLKSLINSPNFSEILSQSLNQTNILYIGNDLEKLAKQFADENFFQGSISLFSYLNSAASYDTRNYLIKRMIEEKEYNQALNFINTIEDKSDKSQELSKFALALFKDKRKDYQVYFNQSYNLLKTIPDDVYYKRRPLNELANDLSEAQLFSQAETVINSFLEKEDMAIAISRLTVLKNRAKVNDNQHLLSRAYLIADSINNVNIKSNALPEVAMAMALTKTSGYNAIFNRLTTAIDSIPTQEEKFEYIYNITNKMIQAKRYKLAYESTFRFVDVNPKKISLLIALHKQWVNN